jgi:hypothetical protein
MQNWEYRVEELRATEDLSEEKLNKFGAEGWELVSTVSIAGNSLEKCIFKKLLSKGKYPDEEDITDEQLNAEVENFLNENF